MASTLRKLEGFLLSATAIAPEKIAAYQATDYRVGEAGSAFILRIGVPSDDLRRLYTATGQACAVFVTAFNPYGTVQSDEANQADHARLSDHIRSLTPHAIEGVGADPSGKWPPEPSILALGIDNPTARLLGARAHQDAVVWAGSDAVPRLLLLR